MRPKFCSMVMCPYSSKNFRTCFKNNGESKKRTLKLCEIGYIKMFYAILYGLPQQFKCTFIVFIYSCLHS